MPPQQTASRQQEIADLERSIQSSERIIEDLDAAVHMEEAKVDENPDYESPILYDVLQEQEQARLEIEKARKSIEALTR